MKESVRKWYLIVSGMNVLFNMCNDYQIPFIVMSNQHRIHDRYLRH